MFVHTRTPLHERVTDRRRRKGLCLLNGGMCWGPGLQKEEAIHGAARGAEGLPAAQMGAQIKPISDNLRNTFDSSR